MAPCDITDGEWLEVRRPWLSSPGGVCERTVARWLNTDIPTLLPLPSVELENSADHSSIYNLSYTQNAYYQALRHRDR